IFEATRVEDRLVIEIEQWRRVSLLVGKHVVCALAQHVKEQDAATEEISLIPRLLLQKRGAGMEIARARQEILARQRRYGRHGGWNRPKPRRLACRRSDARDILSRRPHVCGYAWYTRVAPSAWNSSTSYPPACGASIPGAPIGIPGTANPSAFGRSLSSFRMSAAGTCPSIT